MSREEKLLEKFFRDPPPRDFKWDDFVTMMNRLGFTLTFGGGGTSHCTFSKDDPKVVLDFVRPHNGNELKVVYVKKARLFLIEQGIRG